jgi:hypothetical protein
MAKRSYNVEMPKFHVSTNTISAILGIALLGCSYYAAAHMGDTCQDKIIITCNPGAQCTQTNQACSNYRRNSDPDNWSLFGIWRLAAMVVAGGLGTILLIDSYDRWRK